jgi:hypothetical protein
VRGERLLCQYLEFVCLLCRSHVVCAQAMLPRRLLCLARTFERAVRLFGLQKISLFWDYWFLQCSKFYNWVDEGMLTNEGTLCNVVHAPEGVTPLLQGVKTGTSDAASINNPLKNHVDYGCTRTLVDSRSIHRMHNNTPKSHCPIRCWIVYIGVPEDHNIIQESFKCNA